MKRLSVFILVLKYYIYENISFVHLAEEVLNAAMKKGSRFWSIYGLKSCVPKLGKGCQETQTACMRYLGFHPPSKWGLEDLFFIRLFFNFGGQNRVKMNTSKVMWNIFDLLSEKEPKLIVNIIAHIL